MQYNVVAFPQHSPAVSALAPSPSGSRPFRFEHRVDVRFKDVDIGGHAHHSHALVYMEEARAAYWRDIVGRPGVSDIDYILAEARVRFLARILYPQRLRVAVRVSRLSRRRFDMDYEVRADDGSVLAEGTTVQVMYDYEAVATKAVPPEVKAAIEAFEGPFGRAGRPIGSDDAGP
jgi:acyl-CoA thioester hydrolase